MPLSDLTEPLAVELALEEFDSLGRDAFLAKYHYEPSRTYFVVRNGQHYDSEAIAGAAFGNQFPEQGPLPHDEFMDDDASVRQRLEALGFTVALVSSGGRLASTRRYWKIAIGPNRRDWDEWRRQGYAGIISSEMPNFSETHAKSLSELRELMKAAPNARGGNSQPRLPDNCGSSPVRFRMGI